MTPGQRWRLGPAVDDHYDRHEADPSVHFAFLRTQTRHTKPCVYPDLESLARRIQRERAGSAIELQNQRIAFREAGALVWKPLVAIYGCWDNGTPIRFIGWAWLDGAGRATLRDALYRLVPNPAARAEAA